MTTEYNTSDICVRLDRIIALLEKLTAPTVVTNTITSSQEDALENVCSNIEKQLAKRTNGR